MDPLLGGYQARVDSLSDREQHWVLSRTRNGQQLWSGPYVSRERAERYVRTMLAPFSVIITGHLVSGTTARTACPLDGQEHTAEWCGCTCPA